MPKLEIRHKLFLIPIASVIALLGAFGRQYLFGLYPCELCEYQRVPYAIVILLAILIFISRKKILESACRVKVVLLTYFILMVIESALAFYHFGVEKGYYKGFTACSSTGAAANNASEMLDKIMNAPVVSCNQPQFEFLHISMAGWNGLYSLTLAIISLTFLWKNKNAAG